MTSLQDNGNGCIIGNYMKHKLQKIHSIKIQINQLKYNHKIGIGLTSYTNSDYIYYGGENINFKQGDVLLFEYNTKEQTLYVVVNNEHFIKLFNIKFQYEYQ